MFLLLDSLLLTPDLSLVVGPSSLVASPSASAHRFLLEGLGTYASHFHWALHLGLILTALFSTPLFVIDLFIWLSTVLFASAWNLNIYGLHFYILFSLFLIVSSRFLEAGEVKKYGKILFALTYFNSGFSKILTPEWRSGEALQLIFSSPELGGFPLLDKFWWLIPGWFIMIIQLTYPVTSFLRGKRRLLLILIGISHFFIAVTMEFFLFSLYLIVLNFIFLEQKIPECFSGIWPSKRAPRQA